MTFNLRVAMGLAGTAGALALAVTLSQTPQPASAFSLLGHSLGLDQRDFAVFNNFSGVAANDNTVEHPAFPGSTGATLAIRKAHAEWASLPRAGSGHGDGLASNAVLGDGGANFDQIFVGEADSPGPLGGNRHGALTGGSCAGGVLAFTVFSPSGGGGGWRTSYCDSGWVWSDGPGLPAPGQIDLQAVATREIGFALGLGHSNAGGVPTMSPSAPANLTLLRSIAPDDIAGLQAIYGMASPTKPRITGAEQGAATGTSLTLSGAGFHPTSNEIWITPSVGGAAPVKLVGVPSSAGGTTIVLVVPSDVASGDVLVHTPGSGGDSLSNAWPFRAGAAQDAIVTVGDGLGGTSGEVPQLTAAGDLSPGSATGFTVDVQLAGPSLPGILFLGSASAGLPFKGGVFQPVPILAELAFVTGLAGDLHLAASFDGTVPAGLLIVAQAWFADPSGPAGATSTNGISLLVP